MKVTVYVISNEKTGEYYSNKFTITHDLRRVKTFVDKQQAIFELARAGEMLEEFTVKTAIIKVI